MQQYTCIAHPTSKTYLAGIGWLLGGPLCWAGCTLCAGAWTLCGDGWDWGAAYGAGWWDWGAAYGAGWWDWGAAYGAGWWDWGAVGPGPPVPLVTDGLG